MRYLVVVEKGPSSYGTHVPDLPGCIAAGKTKEEVISLIREAIEIHIEGLKQESMAHDKAFNYAYMKMVAVRYESSPSTG